MSERERKREGERGSPQVAMGSHRHDRPTYLPEKTKMGKYGILLYPDKLGLYHTGMRNVSIKHGFSLNVRIFVRK